MLTEKEIMDILEWLEKNPDHEDAAKKFIVAMKWFKKTNPKKYQQFQKECIMKLGIRAWNIHDRK